MDEKKLRYFAAIAECGSFTKAAVQLRIAQPALSRQIALLEAEFEVELLLRMGRHVVLTEAGEVLLKHARTINEGFQLARDEMESRLRSPVGRVVVGAPPSLGSILIPRLFSRLRAEAPDVRLKVREGTTTYLERAILEGELDVALVAEQPSSQWVQGVTVAMEHIALLGRAELIEEIGRAGASRQGDIPLFVTEQVRALVEPILSNQGRTLPEMTELDAIHGIKQLVLDGEGATLCPIGLFWRDVEARHIVAAHITETPLLRPVIMASSSARSHSRALRTVSGLLREEVEHLDSRGAFRAPEGSRRLDLSQAGVPALAAAPAG